MALHRDGTSMRMPVPATGRGVKPEEAKGPVIALC
jgi:hypothetical protein